MGLPKNCAIVNRESDIRVDHMIFKDEITHSQEWAPSDENRETEKQAKRTMTRESNRRCKRVRKPLWRISNNCLESVEGGQLQALTNPKLLLRKGTDLRLISAKRAQSLFQGKFLGTGISSIGWCSRALFAINVNINQSNSFRERMGGRASCH